MLQAWVSSQVDPRAAAVAVQAQVKVCWYAGSHSDHQRAKGHKE
jgi:hypothetical protein